MKLTYNEAVRELEIFLEETDLSQKDYWKLRSALGIILSTDPADYDEIYSDGWDAGYREGRIESYANKE